VPTGIERATGERSVEVVEGESMEAAVVVERGVLADYTECSPHNASDL
jgi:hypothetical protein